MRESRPPGSVRGVRRNAHPYRDSSSEFSSFWSQIAKLPKMRLWRHYAGSYGSPPLFEAIAPSRCRRNSSLIASYFLCWKRPQANLAVLATREDNPREPSHRRALNGKE